MEDLHVKLKSYRITHSLTQTQIAELLGMTYQEYQKIENGRTNIRIDKFRHICKTLNLSADWLLDLNVDIQKPVSVYDLIGDKPAISPKIAAEKSDVG